MSTWTRAKPNIHCDTLSPVQNTHHSTKAIDSPAATARGENLRSFSHSLHQTVESVVRVRAAHVIVYQKLMCGAVQGENITNHSRAAMRTATMVFLISYIYKFLYSQPTAEEEAQGVEETEDHL